MHTLIMRFLSALLIVPITVIIGCATVLESESFQGYTVGQKLSAPVGGTFLTSQNGRIEKVKRWVGFANSPNGWKIETQVSEDYLRKELIYGGVAGTVIEVSYREYRGGLAAPAFFQTVKYDLSESKTIVFQNFHIQVSSATNRGIVATLLRDK